MKMTTIAKAVRNHGALGGRAGTGTGTEEGFTLIELMITVAIIGILAAIAYPQYSNYVMRSRRTDAKTALLGVASSEEQFFSMNNQYSQVPTNLGYAGAAFPVNVITSGKAYYQLTVTINVGGTTYSASATPVAGGPQAADPCGTFAIDQSGAQTVSGASLTAAECW
jgi:type IV pilus assembly protein PilE